VCRLWRFPSMSLQNVARLPPTFISLYRLFLRAISASVLHQSGAKRDLRRLWRPTFVGAAEVVHRLQSYSQESTERAKLEAWLELWNTRMDSTLNLLYLSSQSRGLPHQLTRNLSRLQRGHLKWTRNHYSTISKTWRPHLDPSSPEYAPKVFVSQKAISKARKTEERLRKQAAFDRSCWGALGEVVRMAEGTHGISLGRATFNKRTT